MDEEERRRQQEQQQREREKEQWQNQATRWPRFFARMFDLGLESLLIGLLVLVLSIGFREFTKLIPKSIILQSMLFLPFQLMLDAIIYWLIGNTPGKALLGLKVRLVDTSPLSFSQYLSRNLTIWGSGLAFGLPLINLFTMAHQARRLGKGQQTSYDTDEAPIYRVYAYRVYAKQIGWTQRCFFALVFLGLLFLVNMTWYALSGH